MSYYEPDTGYYEPSEFEEECEHLKELIKESAFKDVQKENAWLKVENARMKDIVDNYEAKVAVLEDAKRKLDAEKADVMRAVRKERLDELLEPYKSYLWSITVEYHQGPKCDKCDKNRMIHFKSPSGKDYKEECKCAKQIPHYSASHSDVVSLRLDEYSHSLTGFYCETERYQNDDYEYSLKTEKQMQEELYHGQAFSEIKNYWSVCFGSEEKAQEYADWLNAREERKK